MIGETIPSRPRIGAVLDCLNTAFQSDPVAIQALCCNRVPCNQALADHPTIPVDQFPGGDGCIVGAIGLVNGVLDSMDLPLVAMQFSDPLDESGRRKMIGFCEYKNKEPEN